MAGNENYINILLLGETGVGKSTFINALANYLKYNSLEDARNNDLLYFVPSRFTLSDDDFETKVIQIGNSENEVQSPGVSATQNPVSYIFDMKSTKLRIIDTPGIGDTRGISYDEINADKLLNYISQLDYLNGICIILKPNNSRLNVLFEYCIRQILARLDKRVKDNIVFLYTNSRSTFYAPGDTHAPLKEILRKIETRPEDAIPYSPNNTFCIDNEAFRYLVATSQGISFDEADRQHYQKSWEKSSDTCKRLIAYISNLQPLPLIGTVTINECRRIITKLANPVGDMIVNFQRAISRLQQHEDDLQQSTNSIAELKTKLYIPVTQFKVVQKITTTNTTTSQSGGGIGFSFVPPFVHFRFGSRRKKSRTVEKTEVVMPYETTVQDPNVKLHIATKEDAVRESARKIKETDDLLKEYQAEMNVVVNAAVKFTVFLTENAIVAYSDVFEAYFEYLLKREQDKGYAADDHIIKNFEKLMVEYQIKKTTTYNVTPREIFDIMNSLFELKNCGEQLKYFYDKIYVVEDNQIYAIKGPSESI